MTSPAAERLFAAMLDSLHESGDAAICDALELLAADTEKNTFRHAAAFVRGAISGRPAINDLEALRRIATFPLSRRREAIGIVAKELGGRDADPARVDAIARRLRHKRAKMKRKKGVNPPEAGSNFKT